MGLWSLVSLENLNLSFTNLSGVLSSDIGNLINLTELDLSNSSFFGLIPDEICDQGDSTPSLSEINCCHVFTFATFSFIL